MKAVIPGGAGFIGCNLADALLEEGNEVVLFDNLSRRGSKENVEWLQSRHKNLRFVKGDIRTDQKEMEKLFADADAVYHVAAQVAVTTSVAKPREDFEINALGTFNVLEAARNCGGNPALIYASTNKVYGGMEDVKIVKKGNQYAYRDLPNGIPEDRFLDFHSPYGCSKGCGDQYTRDYARIYGLKTVVFRQSCLTGDARVTTLHAHQRMDDLMERPTSLLSFKENQAKEFKLIQGTFRTPTSGKELFRVRTSRWHTIKATGDHPFFTPAGYKELDDIPYGGLVAIHPQSVHLAPLPPHKLPKKTVLREENFRERITAYGRKRKFNETVLKTLKQKDFMPLRYDNEHIYTLAALTGYLTGDGHLHIGKRRKTKTDLGIQVYALKPELEALKEAFRELGFTPGATTVSTSKSVLLSGHVIEGTSHKFNVYATEAFLLFDLLGVPIGDKASSRFLVPDWIMKGPADVQSAYLRGLFGAEMTAPSFYARKIRGKEGEFLSPAFSQSKNVELEANARKFRKQLMDLLKRHGIKTSPPYETGFTYKKGGDKSRCFQFRVLGSKENLLKFARVGYAFNEKRTHTLYNIVEFMKTGLPARHYPEWLKEHSHMLPPSLLWDRILEKKKVPMEPLFDVTVPENHNFVANGFLVHNCIYGHRQFGIEDQGWVAWFAIAAVLGKKITIYGDGMQVRDVLYIDDLVRAFKVATQKINSAKGKIYNIGGGPKNTMSLLELIGFLEKSLGRKINYAHSDWRPGDQPAYVSDIRKAKKELDWEPKVSAEQGVARLLEWVQENKHLFKGF